MLEYTYVCQKYGLIFVRRESYMKNKEELAYSRALVPKYNTLYKIIIVALVILIIALLLVFFGIIKPNFIDKGESGDTEITNISVSLPELYYEDLSNQREIGKTQMKLDYIDNCSYSISYPEVGVEEIDEKILEHARKLKQVFLDNYQSQEENVSSYSQHIDYRSSADPDNNMKLVFVEIISKDETSVESKKEYTYVYNLITGEEISADTINYANADNIELVALEGEPLNNFPIVYSGDIVKYALTTVNIRSLMDLNSPKLGVLEEGDAIEVMSGDKEWETVVFEGNIGFVKTGYLSRKKLLHREIELEVVERGIDPTKPMVAITYDDGPNPKSTPRILDTLEKYGVVATFFDLGQLVNSYPDIVRREEAIGCEVGNHSYSHKNFNVLTDEEIQEEVRNSENAFIKALGHKTVLFRLPYGNINLKVKENMDYPFIKWNVDSLDWKSRNKNKILTQIRKTNNFDGHIILMHSIYGTTADATEVLVPELINKGYQLVTVSELAFYKGYTSLKTAEEYIKF